MVTKKDSPFLVMLTEDLKHRLEQLQERTGSSIGELIRQAVRAYLKKQGIPQRPPVSKRNKK
jgi:predicted transcriptional regulator